MSNKKNNLNEFRSFSKKWKNYVEKKSGRRITEQSHPERAGERDNQPTVTASSATKENPLVVPWVSPEGADVQRVSSGDFVGTFDELKKHLEDSITEDYNKIFRDSRNLVFKLSKDEDIKAILHGEEGGAVRIAQYNLKQGTIGGGGAIATAWWAPGEDNGAHAFRIDINAQSILAKNRAWVTSLAVLAPCQVKHGEQEAYIWAKSDLDKTLKFAYRLAAWEIAVLLVHEARHCYDLGAPLSEYLIDAAESDGDFYMNTINAIGADQVDPVTGRPARIGGGYGLWLSEMEERATLAGREFCDDSIAWMGELTKKILSWNPESDSKSADSRFGEETRQYYRQWVSSILERNRTHEYNYGEQHSQNISRILNGIASELVDDNTKGPRRWDQKTQKWTTVDYDKDDPALDQRGGTWGLGYNSAGRKFTNNPEPGKESIEPPWLDGTVALTVRRIKEMMVKRYEIKDLEVLRNIIATQGLDSRVDSQSGWVKVDNLPSNADPVRFDDFKK